MPISVRTSIILGYLGKQCVSFIIRSYWLYLQSYRSLDWGPKIVLSIKCFPFKIPFSLYFLHKLSFGFFLSFKIFFQLLFQCRVFQILNLLSLSFLAYRLYIIMLLKYKVTRRTEWNNALKKLAPNSSNWITSGKTNWEARL